MTLNIGNKEYKIEFTIEASLCNECTEQVTNLMMSVADASEKQEIKSVVKSMVNIPNTALTMLYAGLLEHHGDEIATIEDAKCLIKEYFAEHKEDGKGNFYALMELLMEQMGNDGFFRQIGLEQMAEQAEEQVKEAKMPQDHKKKATKATGK